MSFGLRIRHPSTGAIVLDTTDRIARVVYTGYHAATGTLALPDFSDEGAVYFIADVDATSVYWEWNDSAKVLSWNVIDGGGVYIIAVAF